MNSPMGEPEAHRLRRTILDAQRGTVPSAMLDCGAHMLLYLDQPQMVHDIALQHLLERFQATRADLGFGSASDPKYQAHTARTLGDCNIPDAMDAVWPNEDRCLQAIWRSSKTLFLDVPRDPVVQHIRPILQGLSTRTKLARRLEHNGRGFGIICIDQTEELRCWSEADLAYLDMFVMGVLSPIVAEIRPRPAPERAALTQAERAVVRLAAQGLSYKEIAIRLQKSPYTVDNQLRKIRQKLNARNRIEILRACGDLL